MSTALLELACDRLGDLADEVVFVGGATIGLWISDPVAPAPRVTNDVDGRPGPGAEIAATPEPLRADLAEGFTRMASRADLPELIEAALPLEAGARPARRWWRGGGAPSPSPDVSAPTRFTARQRRGRQAFRADPERVASAGETSNGRVVCPSSAG